MELESEEKQPSAGDTRLEFKTYTSGLFFAAVPVVLPDFLSSTAYFMYLLTETVCRSRSPVDRRAGALCQRLLYRRYLQFSLNENDEIIPSWLLESIHRYEELSRDERFLASRDFVA